jgi:8-oxo-dGTP pyrophosphatase MutT (NUDIX family)
MLRDAATLILYKEDEAGLRVLMGLRNAGHKFMPNKMVFPGGRVDAEDYMGQVASPLQPAAMARLQRAATPELAAALAYAAARELEEESGLSLGNPPHLAGLDYLCRAETPEGAPIRFNARFFVGHADLVTGTLGGSGELEALDWYALEHLLQLEVPMVTGKVLVQLQRWHELSETERAGRGGLVYRSPHWREE